MSKFIECLFVALISVAVFILVVSWLADASRTSLRKDCMTMGQHRDGSLHITCTVVEVSKP